MGRKIERTPRLLEQSDRGRWCDREKDVEDWDLLVHSFSFLVCPVVVVVVWFLCVTIHNRVWLGWEGQTTPD